MATHGETFLEILQQIGGKSNVHLVSAVSGPEADTGLLRDFIADVFDDEERKTITECADNTNGDVKLQTSLCNDTNGDKTVRSSRRVGGPRRALSCSLVVFIFTRDYVINNDNRVCLREILKDVRVRTQRNVLRPALLGLVHTETVSDSDPILTLDSSLRSVFAKHPQESIWTGRYVIRCPEVVREIRLNISRTVKKSFSTEKTAGSKSWSFWPLTCVPRTFKIGSREEAEFNSSKEHPDSTEEVIPLKVRPVFH